MIVIKNTKKLNLVKLYVVSILILFYNSYTNSIENKILYKLDNEIITSIDFEDEQNYLKIFNPQINSLDKSEQIEIVKKSLFREKIKKIEILNNTEEINLNDQDLELIIKRFKKRLNIEDHETFKLFLKKNNIDFNRLKEKLSIDVYWNELIFAKFISKINIKEDILQKKISEINNQTLVSFKLSELLFEVDNKSTLQIHYNKIRDEILAKGFENTVLIHSIADSKIENGDIGWIEERALNKLLLDEIKKLKIGEFTAPIRVASGFLIIKLNDIKEIEMKIDVNKKLKELTNIERNRQLNQFSNIYFNKIKKEIKIEKL